MPVYDRRVTKRFAFDKAYYDRFYRHKGTRVTTQSAMTKLGRFMCSYLKHMDQPVRNVLDAGCGIGLWQPVIKRHFPRATYTGIEFSRYLCREHGWEHGSVVDYTAAEPYDLVICFGVLQYLSAADCKRAIANLGRLCRGALFLEVLTAEDWEQNCDRSVTDGDVNLRPADWYRRELSKHFTNAGGGVFLSRRSAVVLYELEKLE